MNKEITEGNRSILNRVGGMLNSWAQALGGASMLKFLIRRLLAGIPVLFAIVLVTFILSHLLPGGPFNAVGERRMPDYLVAQLEEKFGLNKSLIFNTWSDGYCPESKDRMEEAGCYDSYNVRLERYERAMEAYPAQLEQYQQDLALYEEEQAAYEAALAQNPNAADNRTFTEEPQAPAEPAKPKKPQPWSWLPVKRSEVRTAGGGATGEISQSDQDIWRLDILDSQFWNYLWDVMHLNFGPSLNKALRDQNVSVDDEIVRRLPVSVQVGVFSVILGFMIGIPLGVLAGVYHNTFTDYLAMFFAVMGQSTPSIVLAPILIIIFAVELRWVPIIDQRSQWQAGPELSLYYLQILALPVITLGTGMSAAIARLTRASLLQVLHEDYVRTARAKGLRERVVIYVHALKNALIPVVTIVGPLLANVLTGSFVVEYIFAIPGLGRAFVESVTARDYTMIMGVSILYSFFLIIGNIIVDIMYTWLDPRIRFD